MLLTIITFIACIFTAYMAGKKSQHESIQEMEASIKADRELVVKLRAENERLKQEINGHE